MTVATLGFWAYLNSVWTDITSDVITGSVRGSWGMGSNHPLDLLAGTGEMTLSLRNSTKKYSLDSASALAGWKRGIAFKWLATFDGKAWGKFYGTVNDIEIDPGIYGERQAHITVLDWMDYAAKHPLLSTGYQTNKRADQAISTILSSMPIQPLSRTLNTGTIAFPALFDTVKSKTKAYAEFSKIIFSEMGYLYVQKDAATGERLVFESNHTRHGWRTLSTIPVAAASSSNLLMEDGSTFLLENGDPLVLDEATTPTYNNSMVEANVAYGDNIINRMTVTAYPKKVDTTTQVLFDLADPMVIGSAETMEFRSNYIDPSGGGAQVSADTASMRTPTETTDYLMNTLEDGTGTDISANLTVTAVYGTEAVTYTLVNTYANTGWITFLQARGKGVYTYNPVESAKQNTASINEFGYQGESLHQKYSRTTSNGVVEANKILENNKNPRTVLNSVSFFANSSDALMFSFLALDVGDLINIIETQLNINGYFYIQGVGFEVLAGGIIKFTWIVKEALTLLLGLSPLAIEFAGGSATDGVNFGYLPAVSNLRQRTIGAWIYMDTDVPDTSYYSIVGYGVNYLFIVKQNRKLKLYQQQVGVSGAGGASWITTSSNVVPLAAWTHVMVTHDTRDWPDNSVPIIYINGAAQTLTEEDAPDAKFGIETGMEFVIGNVHSSNNDYSEAFDGKLTDVRVYDSILTAANAVTLYNSGTPDETLLTDGIVFQAFTVRTGDLTDYVGATLTSETKLIDNMYGAIGTPNGSPIGRTAP